MAEAAPSKEPGDLECSVCSEFFTQPKLLPCAHLLCQGCLISWLDSQPQAQCPLCRFPILQPGQATPKSWDVVADGLPTDLAMAALVEAERLTKQDHQCCFCEKVKATSLCLDCGDMFCAGCKHLHTKQKALKHHRVEDLASMSADQLASHRPEPCPAHADKVCELYCPSHDVAMCHVCAASRHRSCPDVKDVQHKAEECRATLQQLADTLTAKEAALSRALDELDQHQLEMDKKAQAALFEMKTTCDRLKTAIDACYQRAEKQVKDKLSDSNRGVQSGKDYLQERRGRATSHKRTVERAQESKKRDVLTTLTSLLEKRVNELDLSVTLPDDAKVINKVTISFDLEVLKRLEQELSKFLGQVKVEAVPAGLACQKGSVPTVGKDWRFHPNHGENIKLSNNGKTATREDSKHKYNGGVVVGCQQMQENTLYEVCLDKKAGKWSGHLYPGVVNASPDSLTIPTYAHGASPSVWIAIVSDVFFGQGMKKAPNLGNKLCDLPVNSRVGVLVDDKRDLHLYIDGQDQGVAVSNVPDPCYPFFDVFGNSEQVTIIDG